MIQKDTDGWSVRVGNTGASEQSRPKWCGHKTLYQPVSAMRKSPPSQTTRQPEPKIRVSLCVWTILPHVTAGTDRNVSFVRQSFQATPERQSAGVCTFCPRYTPYGVDGEPHARTLALISALRPWSLLLALPRILSGCMPCFFRPPVSQVPTSDTQGATAEGQAILSGYRKNSSNPPVSI